MGGGDGDGDGELVKKKQKTTRQREREQLGSKVKWIFQKIGSAGRFERVITS